MALYKARNSYNPYTDGFGDLTANQLKNISLPEKLRCKRCDKWKSTVGKENFSNKQLAEARGVIHYGGHGKHAPFDVVCVTCTSKQIHELHCVICDSYKGLDYFAKAQRRAKDDAKCLACMDEQLEFDPDTAHKNLVQLRDVRNSDSDGDSGGDEYEYDDEDEDGPRFQYSYADDTDTTSNMGNLSMTDTTSESDVLSSCITEKTGSRDISMDVSTDVSTGASSGGVHLSQASQDWQTVGNTRARKGAPTTASTSRPAMPSSNSSGFAKVRAYKAPADGYEEFQKGSQKIPATMGPQSVQDDRSSVSDVSGPDWQSDSESSDGTEVPDEHEINWDSDSDSDDE